VNWDKQTFARLMVAPPERLTSQFQITHGMLLNVLSRPTDGCRAMQALIARCHEMPKAKKALTRRGWQLFRSLVERGIVEFIPPGERVGPVNGDRGTVNGGDQSRSDSTAKVRVNVELQDDFSMNQTLSLYVHDTLPLMDPQAPDYALVVLTLVESILEDPDIILRRQLDKVKTQAVAEMKMQGIEYDQRMEELEKLEHPKPNRDFIYSTFNAFAARHPWVGQENIRPKSIAREMFEEFRSFADYIKIYDIQRAEGVLLRHLSSVFKVLAQTVPDAAKNDILREMELYLATMLRQIDSSLLDEWEKMRDPNYMPRGEQPEVRPPGAEEAARDITRDAKAFTAAIRNRIFTFLRALTSGDLETALAGVNAHPSTDEEPWTTDRLRRAIEAYHADHEYLRLDPEARNLRHTYVTSSDDRRAWRVQQMLVDPAEANDWVAEFHIDLAASREAGEPQLQLRRLGSLV
jgi:hypothetical protein